MVWPVLRPTRLQSILQERSVLFARHCESPIWQCDLFKVQRHVKHRRFSIKPTQLPHSLLFCCAVHLRKRLDWRCMRCCHSQAWLCARHCWWHRFRLRVRRWLVSFVSCLHSIHTPLAITSSCMSLCARRTSDSRGLCDIAVCPSACVNGNCTAPATCTCLSGWTGATCATCLVSTHLL